VNRAHLALLAVVLLAGQGVGRAQVAEKSKAGAGPARPQVVNRIRFFPTQGHEQAMVGGKFTGSNRSATAGFEVLAEIKDVPPAAQWSELAVPNETPYRWLRYEAPSGSDGSVAEIQFYSGERKLNGAGYGTVSARPAGSWNRALDGDPKTSFAGEGPGPLYVGVDLGENASTRTPRMEPPPGEHDAKLAVTLRSATPGATIRFTRDGTTPGPGQGSAYDAPIAVGTTSTLTAVAFKEGMAPSPPS